jgi:AcrR family transcriptional regulator
MSVLREPVATDARTFSPQAAARREQILEAALEAISRKGYHQTSIADIARRARASRATVYQYFRNKQDILAAIGHRVETRIIGAVDTWVPLPSGMDGADPEHESQLLIDRLRSMIDTRIRQVMSAIYANADAARLVLRLIRGYEGAIDDAMRRIDAHVVGILTRDVEAAIGHGWARACDAELTARYLLGGIEKILMDVLDPGQPLVLDVPRVAREIGALVFFGLAHPDLLREAARGEDRSIRSRDQLGSSRPASRTRSP